MIEIVALYDTVIKESASDSSELPPNMKKSVPKNSVYKLDHYTRVGSLAKADIDGVTQYFYMPHWKGFGIYYPNGLPRPYVPTNPTKNQVIRAIVDYSKDVGVLNRREIAYILATAENESNFKPVREYRGKTLSPDQKRYWNTGYYGRGFIQVTWKSNYQKIDRILGINSLENPDELLEYDTAITCLVIGMRDGWYTGKKLSDYSSYAQMRNIVNPGEIRAYPERNAKFVNSAVKWEDYLAKSW